MVWLTTVLNEDIEVYSPFGELERRVRLTPTEWAILNELARSFGTTAKKERIMDAVWGDNPIGDESLRAHIKAIRQKLAEGTVPLKITNTRRSGYSLSFLTSPNRFIHCYNKNLYIYTQIDERQPITQRIIEAEAEERTLEALHAVLVDRWREVERNRSIKLEFRTEADGRYSLYYNNLLLATGKSLHELTDKIYECLSNLLPLIKTMG